MLEGLLGCLVVVLLALTGRLAFLLGRAEREARRWKTFGEFAHNAWRESEDRADELSRMLGAVEKGEAERARWIAVNVLWRSGYKLVPPWSAPPGHGEEH